MLRILIADDELYMRIILRKALANVPEVDVVAEVDNGVELIETAIALMPDIVFADISMPELDGLEAARRIFNINPNVFIIFVTAFDTYTHEAFEIYAFDYLVKPFNPERIIQTVERIKSVKRERDENLTLKKQIEDFKKIDAKIRVKSLNKQYLIDSQDIILITRFDRKTIINTKNGLIETAETLRDLSHRLSDKKFFRCHKGYIINVGMISEIIPWGNKTFLVKFSDTDETALMTIEKAREFKMQYS